MSYWPGKASNTSSQDTDTVLEMHQSPSKGERTAARLPSLSQRGRERQKQQPGCNPAAPSESAGEGRKFLREAARQAGQTGQAHIPNSSRALRNTEHVPHALKALGGDDNGSRGISFSSAGHSALCEEGQQQQPREKLLAHLPLQLCTSVIQKLWARAALLLDTSAYV